MLKQKMLNKDSHSASCACCIHGNIPKDKSMILCKYKGVTNADESCKKFKYDPLKRVPKKMQIATDFDAEDFKL